MDTSKEDIVVGTNVVYKKPMKGLPDKSTGVVDSVYGDRATICYPQFSPQEEAGKYKFTNHVYCHSALLTDLKTL